MAQAGILGLLSNLLGGGPPNTGQFAQTAGRGPVAGPNTFPPAPDLRAQPPRGSLPPVPKSPSLFSQILDPDVALPTAAVLMGSGSDMDKFGAAFGQIGQGLKRNKTLDMIRQKDPALAELVDLGLEPKDALSLFYQKQKAQDAPQVETFYDKNGAAYKAQWNASTRQWDQVGGSKGDEGLEMVLPDGTTVRQGSFGNQHNKNVANRINDEQEASKAAANLKATVGMLRKANQNTGYSGVGGDLYGTVDDTLEQFGYGDKLSGNAGARATMRSGGLDVALSQVQKTKGAISNAEMSLFMAAAPGMQNTPQGNKAMLDILDAVADRQIQRTAEAEKWRQQFGTLDGFEAAWGKYMSANPLLKDDGNGSVSLAGGNSSGGPQVNTLSNGVQWSIEP